MVLSDLAKSDLESGAWVDRYDYQNKDKNEHYHYENWESVLFFSAHCIITKTMWFPTLL